MGREGLGGRVGVEVSASGLEGGVGARVHFSMIFPPSQRIVSPNTALKW